ncbi:MAG: hypothetical protein HKN60_10070 [Rhizobiales bacterium]|nr:hypothetical protein [Hyphomicrobiales bacterium]
MDYGIWAVWYNLDQAKRDSHLDWLHGTHLPELTGMPGIVWAANYRVDEDEYRDRRDLLAHTSDPIPQGTQYVCLVAAASPYLFFSADSPFMEENQTDDVKNHLNEREEARLAVLIEEESVNGPAYRQKTRGSAPAKAIQMGSFNMTGLETDIMIGQWYARLRMPDMAETPGVIGCRKLLALVGWCRHAVLYEFESHEMRREHAIKPHTPWSKEVIDATVHAPGSPLIGYRTWPAAD